MVNEDGDAKDVVVIGRRDDQRGLVDLALIDRGAIGGETWTTPLWSRCRVDRRRRRSVGAASGARFDLEYWPLDTLRYPTGYDAWAITGVV